VSGLGRLYLARFVPRSTPLTLSGPLLKFGFSTNPERRLYSLRAEAVEMEMQPRGELLAVSSPCRSRAAEACLHEQLRRLPEWFTGEWYADSERVRSIVTGSMNQPWPRAMMVCRLLVSRALVDDDERDIERHDRAVGSTAVSA
jgi:hypothetical protein